ncbi:MAG: hypothetical protein WD431_09900 [Cyclobacteriaceae bacterium]
MRKFENSKQLAERIKRTIESIRYVGIEYLFVFGKNGRMEKYVGEENIVSMPNTHLYKLKNSKLVHNHPRGCSFSLNDISVICTNDVHICYLVTRKYVFILERPKSGWNIDVASENFEKTCEICWQIANETFDKMIARNEISEYEREVEIIHYIWALFFRIKEIDYARKTHEDFKITIQ